MLAVFAIQQTAAGAVFRQQFVEANTRGLFSEQLAGGYAVFREQFWTQDVVVVPVPVPTKVSIRMLSSGKVRLVNGRILLSHT